MDGQMSGYSLIRYWDAASDCRRARVSMAGPTGAEYHITIDDNAGPKVYRKRRDDAVDAIAAAIERMDEPGEVECRFTT